MLSSIATLLNQELSQSRLKIAVRVEIEQFKDNADQLNLVGAVEFLRSVLPNTQVVHLMRAADAVRDSQSARVSRSVTSGHLRSALLQNADRRIRSPHVQG